MSKTAELVFIPSPEMGHLLSIVQVAKLIVQRNDHISVYIHIINMSNQHSAKVNAYVNSQSHDNPYPNRLTFVTLPPLSDPPESFSTTVNLHKPLVKQVVEDRVKNGFPKPAGFVLDMFCTTMVDIANELEISSYVFFTSGAILLHFTFYTQTLVDDHGLEARDIAMKFSDPEFSELIPGFKNPITSKNVPSPFQDTEFGCVSILNLARKFRQMKGILVNSYVELESSPIQALQNNDDGKTPPIYPVGPILELEAGGGSHDVEKESIIKWLDDQPQSSVVFLCFGSMGAFSKEQVKEIAHGLDRSGFPFLWALRTPLPKGNVGLPKDNAMFLDALPEGFLDRTINKGKIIGWAPQIEVLAHSAVGGFVSHCGWNSTLESLWFGVPIGTWPMYAEQQLNAFELVKELELAVDVRMDYKIDSKTGKANILVTSADIEQGVMKLMSMDGKVRDSVKEASNKGRKALEDGGSSYLWLGRFIEDVLSNVGFA